MNEIILNLATGNIGESSPSIYKIFSIAPGHIKWTIVLLSLLFIINEFIRTYLLLEHTTSVATHVVVNVLTLLPSFILIVVLVYSGYKYPDRTFINLVVALICFIPWYIGGQLTFLARTDSEGADVGFIIVGLCLVIPSWLITNIIF